MLVAVQFQCMLIQYATYLRLERSANALPVERQSLISKEMDKNKNEKQKDAYSPQCAHPNGFSPVCDRM